MAKAMHNEKSALKQVRSKRRQSLETIELDLSISNDSKLRRVPRLLIERSVRLCLRQHRIEYATVSVVFIDDPAMRRMNKKFLQHDYVTDIITFPMVENEVDGELYISVDTARRQAAEYGVSFQMEVLRLVVHGVLHLIGFDDATPKLRERMHREENIILEQL